MFQKIVNKLNDLRPKQLLMLAGATAILMFAVIYVGLSLATGSKEIVQLEPEQPPPVATKPVVVAKVNLPPRTRIQESMLQIKEMPVDMVPEGAIESFDEVKDVQIKISIFAGDILTIQKVFNEKGSEGFVGEIPADCRAVSINVSEVTSVAGFAKPGDKVDLLLVEKSNYSATTNLILQNVPLLSINQDMLGSNIRAIFCHKQPDNRDVRPASARRFEINLCLETRRNLYDVAPVEPASKLRSRNGIHNRINQ